MKTNCNEVSSYLLKTVYNETINSNLKNQNNKQNIHKDKIFLEIASFLTLEDICNLKLTCKTISYALNQNSFNTLLKRFHLKHKKREHIFFKYLHINQ
jgi:hypothetical protein